ncbi:hypothetical protein [Escherichia coli]|uniref:hypothetical protein n=1 Tax=Escherichia coli TaxID=562 RepID=UPI0009A4A299|nr:hypothetical protein [Escherichia coli]OPJ23857.1 hypothetical protein BFQ24_25275 [Escherichia coli]
MFKFPTSRLFSTLKSALRPAMPRFKVSATWLLTLAWIFLLVWIWLSGLPTVCHHFLTDSSFPSSRQSLVFVSYRPVLMCVFRVSAPA